MAPLSDRPPRAEDPRLALDHTDLARGEGAAGSDPATLFEPRPELDHTAVASQDPDASVDAPVAIRRGSRRRRTLDLGSAIARYEITGRLGDGGMGTVYAAHDPKLDRDVAIKILHTASDEAALRLEREAQALAKLEHPNVVAVYDSGEHGDIFFIVMQLVHGENLARELRLRPRRPAEVIALFVAAGRGLAAAHAAGIVHRDFKPANVLVDGEGRVAVTDFGLARAVGELAPGDLEVSADGSASSSTVSASGTRASISASSSRRANWSEQQLTQVGAVMGTPAYMSPEQHQGAVVSAASDQFSFAVALWEALYGQHPFVTPELAGSVSPFACGVAILEGTIVPPPPGRGVPTRIETALRRGLADQPGARWPSMNALLDRLAPPVRRRRGMVAVVAVVAAAASGIGVWAATTRTQVVAAPSCAATTQARVDAVWSAATLAAMRSSFAATELPFAGSAATQLGARLDAYGSRWQQQAIDDCLTERSVSVDPDLRKRRTACLDDSLADLRSVAQAVSGPVTPEVVAHAGALVDALPPLAACADADALRSGPGTPPPALANRIEAARGRLTSAKIAYRLGRYLVAQGELEALAPEVASLGWGPLAVELGIVQGQLAFDMHRSSTVATMETAQRAVELRMDAAAATAWSIAMESAALDRDASAQRTFEAVALATARRTADPQLVFEVSHARARALLARRQYKAGLEACHALEPQIAKLASDQDRARAAVADCTLSALSPLGLYAEAAPLVERELATAIAVEGADHPHVATLLITKARILGRASNMAESRVAVERAIAIRLRAFGPGALETLVAERELITFDFSSENFEAINTRARSLLAAVTVLQPPPLALIYALHRDLGMGLQGQNRIPEAIAEFEIAIADASKLAGGESLDVALLMIMVGQYKSMQDADAGIALLHHAAEILDGLSDKRAEIARGAEALVLYQHDRCAEAVPIYDQVLATSDLPNMEQGNLGRLRYQLAQCLDTLHRDPERAHALAVAARVNFAASGEGDEFMLGKVNAFLKKTRVPPRHR